MATETDEPSWLSNVRKYVHERSLLSHRFGDDIHWLHAGTEREATLTLTTLRAMIDRIDADAQAIAEMKAAADDMRIARTLLDLATSNGVVNWIRCAFDELDELHAVVGPPMPCGCYAVEIEVPGSSPNDHTRPSPWCRAHGRVPPSHLAAPKYTEWRRSRDAKEAT